jgi:hypothetical protein
MELEPKSLNIPLKRKDRLGLVLVGTCVLAAIVTWLFDASFARVFAATCIVCLPALWLFFALPPTPQAFFSTMPTLVRYLLLLGYFALAKAVLLPAVLSLIGP